MALSADIVWFTIFSIGGWLWESVYCAVNTRRWQNRGFLFGPVCPIYGFGGIAIVIFYELAIRAGGSPNLTWPQVFLLSAAGSAVLEYVTSWVLEQAFHARWWDYSNVPLNIQGRIALPCTLAFGAAGCLGFYFVADPIVTFIESGVVPALAWELAALIIVGLLGADLALTLSALFDLDDKISAMQADFDAVMEVAVADINAGRRPLAEDFAGSATERAHRAAEHTLTAATDRVARGMRASQRGALKRIKFFSTEARADAAEKLKDAAARAKDAASAAKSAAVSTSGAAAQTAKSAAAKAAGAATKAASTIKGGRDDE